MEAKLFVFAAVAISEVFSACAPSHTKFDNFQKTPKRSIRFKIGVVSKKCPGIDEFYYRWTVQEIPGYKTLRSTSEPSLSIDGYTFPSSNCYLVEYLVTVKVSHYPDMTYPDEKKGKFHFMPDQMHLEILGGYEKTHSYGDDLLIDAKTLSLDPSYLPEEDGLDGNIIRWSFSKELKGFVPANALVFVVPAKLLKVGKYEFTLTLTRIKIPNYKDVAEVTQFVDVINQTFPHLNILCLRNCNYPNHMEITMFIVDCSENCENITEFYWRLEPPVRDPLRIDLGNGSDRLIVLNGAYREGTSLKVNVRSHPSSFSVLHKFATGLVKGKCKLHPRIGISSVTKFKVNCTGFNSPYGVVIYNIYQQLGPELILINEEGYYDESEVYLTASRRGRIIVEVLDNAYLNRYTRLRAYVKEYRPQENIELESAVKNLVLATDNTSITSYSIEGFNNEAVQLTLCMLYTMKDIKMDDGTTRDLHKHMVEALLRIHPVKFSRAFQKMQALLKVASYRLDDDSETAKLIMKATTDATLHVHEMHNHEHDRNIPQNLIENFVTQSIDIISSVLRKSDVVLEILNEPAPLNDYDSFEHFISRKVEIRDDYEKMINNVLIILQANCITALYQTFPDEKPKFYDNGVLAVETQRKSIFDSKLLTLHMEEGDTATKVLVTPEILGEIGETNSFVDFQLGLFMWNPFWWHNNGTKLRTHVLLFDMFIGCYKVTDIRNPFYIEFQILELPIEVITGTLTDKNLAVYKVDVGPYRSLFVRFENIMKSSAKYNVTWADCFCKEEDFQSPKGRAISLTPNSTGSVIEIPNDDGATKVVFLCIKKVSANLTYEMTLTTFSCVHWDFQKQELSGKGCRVIQAGFDSHLPLICECYHRSIFAGQIDIPATYLMLPTDADFTLGFFNNYVMLVVVAAVILLYIISLILAHYRDKSMRRKNIVHKLDDNIPGDPHPYLVVFFTGFFFDAPTTADVGFQLIGEQANSRTHVVKCEGFKLLQRNAQDWFTIYTPDYLGHLKKLKMWTNCKGKYPHWYCERVIVQDLRTATQYCFTVKKWFSVTWGTRKIYREFDLKSHKQEDPKMIFYTHVERDIKDNHMWISIFERDVQSNFNSKERVSVGFVFVFLTMLANALIAGVPSGSPTDSIDQNKYFVNVSHIIIFFEAWLAALPPALFILFIFKYSKPL